MISLWLKVMDLCNYLPTPLDPAARPRLRPGQPFLSGLGLADILDAFHGIVPGTKYVCSVAEPEPDPDT